MVFTMEQLVIPEEYASRSLRDYFQAWNNKTRHARERARYVDCCCIRAADKHNWRCPEKLKKLRKLKK